MNDGESASSAIHCTYFRELLNLNVPLLFRFFVSPHEKELPLVGVFGEGSGTVFCILPSSGDVPPISSILPAKFFTIPFPSARSKSSTS